MSSYDTWLKQFFSILCILALCVSTGLARTKKSSHRAASRSVTSHSAARSHSSSEREDGVKRTSSRKYGKSATKTRPTVKTVHRGQQAIENERAREIQEALIRANYLDGEPSGVWDQQTRDALTRFQGDHGWQTKIVPDSRALIKLGLGPNHSDVIGQQTSFMRSAGTFEGGVADSMSRVR